MSNFILFVQHINDHMAKYMTLPDNWHSKKYGFEFVEIINRVVEKELTSELTNAAFYTLTINETTDIFVNKGLIVYFKFRPNNFDIQYIVIYGGIIQLEACEFPENVSCDLPANTQPSISKITESQFTPIPDDPCKWPESISDAQRCDIVKRGPHQLIMNFPYNNTTPRRRFSSNHYKRVLPNGESVSRSWLVYSGESDQVFCFCCKLFGKTLSPFCSGINTWEGFSKKLKDHENGISHQECCSQ